jgi:cell division control protein 45
MDMDLKRLLRDKMDDIAPEYGLVELSYPSFVRSFGFRTQPLCAADVVEGVSALLQAAGGVRLEVETEGGQGGGEWFGGSHLWDMRNKSGSERNGSSNDKWKSFGSSLLISSGEDDAAEGDGHGPEMENWWVRNFWVAFDALGNEWVHSSLPYFQRLCIFFSSIRLVQDALPLSMALHRAIIRQGSSLIDKHAIRNYRTFKLAVVKEGPDVPIFCHPGTLSRLGLWLAEALRDRDGIITGSARGKRKQLPFVVACLNEKAGSYLIVGVTPTSESGDVRKK